MRWNIVSKHCTLVRMVFRHSNEGSAFAPWQSTERTEVSGAFLSKLAAMFLFCVISCTSFTLGLQPQIGGRLLNAGAPENPVTLKCLESSLERRLLNTHY